jgi:TonB family protein
MRRFGLFVAFGVSMLALCSVRALAVTEYCPASVSAFHPLDGQGSATLFAYALEAGSARSVSTTVMVHTNLGWFEVRSAAAIPLVKYNFDYADKFVEFTRTSYQSAPLYVRFPQPVSLISYFVSEAQALGDTQFGWDAKGNVTCSAPAGLESRFTPDLLPVGVTSRNPRIDLDVQPPPQVAIASPSLTSAPGPMACEHPFSEPKTTHIESPEFPIGEAQNGSGGVAWIELAVNASGALDDAWIFAPSGSRAYDTAAMQALRKTTFQPGTAFCAPAPKILMFGGEFDPD